MSNNQAEAAGANPYYGMPSVHSMDEIIIGYVNYLLEQNHHLNHALMAKSETRLTMQMEQVRARNTALEVHVMDLKAEVEKLTAICRKQEEDIITRGAMVETRTMNIDPSKFYSGPARE